MKCQWMLTSALLVMLPVVIHGVITYDTVTRLREELGVTVMAGDQIDTQKLASDPWFIFQASYLYQVSSLSDQIVRTLCEVATTTATTATLSTTTTTTTVKPCVTKSQADIIFILDASSSIGKVNWAYQRKFAAELTQAFEIGPNDVQFGAVIFNSNVTKLFDLNKYSDKTKLYRAISSVRYPFAYGTQTYKAFQMVREEGLFTVKYGGRNLKRIAIIMTDGESDNMTKTIEEADLLKEEGVTVLSVGIGSAFGKEELRHMASDPEKNVFTADSFKLLKLIQEEVVNTTCEYV